MTTAAIPIRDTGFSYIRVTVDVLSNVKPATVTPVTDEEHVVLVGETGSLTNSIVRCFDTNAWAYKYQVGRLAIVPFDMEAEFPGRTVRAYTAVRSEFDFDAWMRTQVEVPAELDVTFEYERYRHRGVAVIARTMKKGKIQNVRKSLLGEKPFIENVRDVLEELKRVAPAPVTDLFADPLPDYTCGTHVAELLTMLDEVGHAMVSDWLKRDLEQREGKNASQYGGNQMAIPGAFLIGAKVDKLVLQTTTKSNAVLATITMRGDHHVEDDHTGSRVVLLAQIPETVLGGMRKRSVGDIVDAGWAKGLTIRTLPTGGDSCVSFRAFSDTVPLVLGKPVPVPDEEIERRLRRAFVDGRKGSNERRHPIWSEVDTAIVPVLESLDDRTLSVIVAKLEMFTQISLDEYGHQGWTLRSQGPRMIADQQPAVPVERLGVTDRIRGRRAA